MLKSAAQWFTWVKRVLSHWGRVTHICVSKLTPGRRQIIIWSNAGILLIRTLGTNVIEIFNENHTFSFKKMHLKMSAELRQFCLGLNLRASIHFNHKGAVWPTLCGILYVYVVSTQIDKLRDITSKKCVITFSDDNIIAFSDIIHYFKSIIFITRYISTPIAIQRRTRNPITSIIGWQMFGKIRIVLFRDNTAINELISVSVGLIGSLIEAEWRIYASIN